jgi:hypothetical protein
LLGQELYPTVGSQSVADHVLAVDAYGTSAILLFRHTLHRACFPRSNSLRDSSVWRSVMICNQLACWLSFVDGAWNHALHTLVPRAPLERLRFECHVQARHLKSRQRCSPLSPLLHRGVLLPRLAFAASARLYSDSRLFRTPQPSHWRRRRHLTSFVMPIKPYKLTAVQTVLQW